MKRVVFLIFMLVVWFALPLKAQVANGSLMKVNFKSIVSRADLNYTSPVKRSEEGIPVGNGRTGSLLWTTPGALHFQINRVDVFSIGCYTNSFPIAHSDYSNGCGYVDIIVGDYDNEIFTSPSFNQHLSIFEGLATVKGNGIDTRVIAWNDGDVIATEITDQRTTRQLVNIDLRMLRYVSTYLGNNRFDMFNTHTGQNRVSYCHFKA
jgi:hypothetical protein